MPIDGRSLVTHRHRFSSCLSAQDPQKQGLALGDSVGVQGFRDLGYIGVFGLTAMQQVCSWDVLACHLWLAVDSVTNSGTLGERHEASGILQIHWVGMHRWVPVVMDAC